MILKPVPPEPVVIWRLSSNPVARSKLNCSTTFGYGLPVITTTGLPSIVSDALLTSSVAYCTRSCSGSAKSASRRPCCIWKPARSGAAATTAPTPADRPCHLAVRCTYGGNRLGCDVDAVLARGLFLHGDVG